MAIQVSNKYLCKVFRNGTIEVVDIVAIIPIIVCSMYGTGLIGCIVYLRMVALFNSDPLNIMATLDIRNMSLYNLGIFIIIGVITIGNIAIAYNLLNQLLKIVKVKFQW